MPFYLWVTVIAAAGALAAGPVAAYEGGEVSKAGTVKGKIKFQGDVPAREKIKITRNEDVCGKTEKHTESLIVSNDGDLKNAVVMLVGVQSGKPFSGTSKMDQSGCRFHPHVLVVPVGQEFELLNSDGILHNFHTTSSKNPVINKAQPKFKRKLMLKVDKPEIIRVNCDVHEWMNGWLVATEHPYVAVTDENGSFTIDGIPPGTYDIKVWHETLGQKTGQVSVGAGDVTRMDFQFEKTG